MTIFIAGIHGVGKTHLGKSAAETLGLRYATASQLIREERGRGTWGHGKLVDEVEQNQAALVAAMQRLRSAGEQVLLDGHFVLRKSVGVHERLPPVVFRALDCTAVVVLTCAPEKVRQRLIGRGDETWSELEITQFAGSEVEHARSVCNELGVRLAILHEPEQHVFEKVVLDMIAVPPDTKLPAR